MAAPRIFGFAVFCWTVAGTAAMALWRPPTPHGHVMSGVPISAAGVVPYVNLPGRGVHFLLQNMVNGSRTGKLCDFGGRREATDADCFVTAARELCEETGNAFGSDVQSLAESLREQASVRILNRAGRYVTFFLKVDYCHPAALPILDTTDPSEPVERSFRWWRSDELLGRVDESMILERMIILPSTISGAGVKPPSSRSGLAADVAMAPAGDLEEPRTLSSFHSAVCKTLTVENAHPYAHEKWHETVFDTLNAEAQRRAEDQRHADALAQALAAVEVSKDATLSRMTARSRSASYHPAKRPTSRAFSRPAVKSFSPAPAAAPNAQKRSGTPETARPANQPAATAADLAPKRGSRRGPPQGKRPSPAWQEAQAAEARREARFQREKVKVRRRRPGKPTAPEEAAQAITRWDTDAFQP